MAVIISKVIKYLFFILCGFINCVHLSPLNNCNDELKRTYNIEILNSNVTIINGADKFLNDSNSDNNILLDTRFELVKSENKLGYNTSGQLEYPRPYSLRLDNCFSYKVMAKNQTHIALFSDKVKKNPWVEIVIGGLPDGLGNIFRKNGIDIGGTYNQQQNSLNEYEYRGYWISFADGHYNVGVKGKRPFMSWHDPNPFDIKYIGIDTCCGTIGHVVIESGMCPGINM